jgi:hypothetical protein
MFEVTMSALRHVRLLAIGLVLAACTNGAPATTAPTGAPATTAPTEVPPTAAPATFAPTTAPSASLDPSLSDAGVVGRVTISNDTRSGRDGTHDIVGVAADGSDCSLSWEGDEYTAVAWYDDAPDGMIHQMAVTIAADEVPDVDGESTMDITDGRVYIDFVSESGFGTAYSGDSTEEGEGSVTIDVTRVGEGLVFDFHDGVTWDEVRFAGQMACAAG